MSINSSPLPMREFGHSGVQVSAIACGGHPQAADGHNELFKMTVQYDAKIGREQHHFPSEEELPL